jgi:hypothetical protein
MERQGGHVGGIQGWIICDVVKEYYELPYPLEMIFWLMDEMLKGITLRPLTPYV